MGKLHDIGLRHGTDKATHHKYCDFYESRIGNPKSILEFGVLNGASLRMWRDAFPNAAVVGFDIDVRVNPEGTTVLNVDCTQESWVWKLRPQLDLIIDDGSHMINDQMRAFELWWPRVNKGGRYIIEDIHTMHFDQYNPERFDLIGWIKSLEIKHEIFERNPAEPDSKTVIFFK